MRAESKEWEEEKTVGHVMQKRIKSYIQSNGIKQRHIANITGLKECHISDLLTSRTKMDADEFVAISLAVGQTPDFFAFQEEEK